MKAYRLHEFGGPDALKCEELPGPKPGAGQVLVRLRAASLNFRDLMVAKGIYNPRLKLPIIPMSDGAGEVVATGDGASRFKPGDRVVACFAPAWLDGPMAEASARSALGADANGVLAEEVVFPEAGLLSIPAHLSYEEAATLPCAAVTAWNALVESGGIKPGDTVLIQGTGGVSLFAPPVREAGRGDGHRHIQQRRQTRACSRHGRLGGHQLQDRPRLGQTCARSHGRPGS